LNPPVDYVKSYKATPLLSTEAAPLEFLEYRLSFSSVYGLLHFLSFGF
jgi:hypothetical protein